MLYITHNSNYKITKKNPPYPTYFLGMFTGNAEFFVIGLIVVFLRRLFSSSHGLTCGDFVAIHSYTCLQIYLKLLINIDLQMYYFTGHHRETLPHRLNPFKV